MHKWTGALAGNFWKWFRNRLQLYKRVLAYDYLDIQQYFVHDFFFNIHLLEFKTAFSNRCVGWRPTKGRISSRENVLHIIWRTWTGRGCSHATWDCRKPGWYKTTSDLHAAHLPEPHQSGKQMGHSYIYQDIKFFTASWMWKCYFSYYV